jgi:CHASE2 domain-containing sensor protein
MSKENKQYKIDNRTIIWYIIKYLFIGIVTMYTWSVAAALLTAPHDIKNLVGLSLFAGLLICWCLLVKSELEKHITIQEKQKVNKK